MSAEFDVIIVGSGPAGVSAAFPLVKAGLKVLLVDGGRKMQIVPPSKPYLVNRAQDAGQWEWMVGRDYHSLRSINTVSPKLRVPTLSYVFEDFEVANKIDAKDFITIGSLAPGGMSNAWGCGIARLSPEELNDFPFEPSEILSSYETVARRIGVSGALRDDLSEYFGLDEWADPPIPIDDLRRRVLDRYEIRKSAVTSLGFRLGRSRIAVLSRDRDERKACDTSGNCMWGCHRRALYSATEDLRLLKNYSNFTYKSGFVVDEITSVGASRAVMGSDIFGNNATISASKIVLAAGTLATTRLALQALHLNKPVSMHACPIAAFMLWLPKALGSARPPVFGLGQLSFALELQNGVSGFGSLFNTTGIPSAEFVRYMPFSKRYGIDFLKALLSSCLVGNLFLPGNLSTAKLTLRSDGSLCVEGGFRKEVEGLMRLAEQRLRKAFWKLGALLLPMSFTLGKPGGDIHYSCSLPMREKPNYGETNAFGELFGLDNVYIVDGASLSDHSEKSHTLTVMANADRIGKKISVDFDEVR